MISLTFFSFTISVIWSIDWQNKEEEIFEWDHLWILMWVDESWDSPLKRLWRIGFHHFVLTDQGSEVYSEWVCHCAPASSVSHLTSSLFSLTCQSCIHKTNNNLSHQFNLAFAKLDFSYFTTKKIKLALRGGNGNRNIAM